MLYESCYTWFVGRCFAQVTPTIYFYIINIYITYVFFKYIYIYIFHYYLLYIYGSIYCRKKISLVLPCKASAHKPSFLICKNNRLKLQYPCIRRYQSYHLPLTEILTVLSHRHSPWCIAPPSSKFLVVIFQKLRLSVLVWFLGCTTLFVLVCFNLSHF